MTARPGFFFFSSPPRDSPDVPPSPSYVKMIARDIGRGLLLRCCVDLFFPLRSSGFPFPRHDAGRGKKEMSAPALFFFFLPRVGCRGGVLVLPCKEKSEARVKDCGVGVTVPYFPFPSFSSFRALPLFLGPPFFPQARTDRL